MPNDNILELGTWLKGHEYAQLTHILVPDDANNLVQTTWKPIVDAKELYQILTSKGQIHYHQAAETLLVKGPFAARIGPFTDNEYCDTILLSKVCHTWCVRATRA